MTATLMDPDRLRRQVRTGLGIVGRYRHVIQVSGGFQVIGESETRITNRTVRELENLKLVRRSNKWGRYRLELTGVGRMTYDIMVERAAR